MGEVCVNHRLCDLRHFLGRLVVDREVCLLDLGLVEDALAIKQLVASS
jgi:hypothetical protein